MFPKVRKAFQGVGNDEISMVEGGKEVSRELLKLPFNHIFFTGSPGVGKVVLKAAAEHLSTVILELGGNPR